MFANNKVIVKITDLSPVIVIKSEYRGKRVGNIKCAKNNKTITICDIWCEKNNRGYGSLMMEALIDYARQQGITSIEGWLSSVDVDHIERLYHYYQKFGFEIIPHRDGLKIADIKLKI